MQTAFAQTVAATEVVRYSQVWEDHRLLERGLVVNPDDDVLSIGSAGCNVLALLLREPRSITAVDLNPAQSALVELKLGAIRALSYDDFVYFIGARAGRDRLGLYQRVRPHLGATARRFWDHRPDDLHAGVIHMGRLERFIRAFQVEHVNQAVAPSAVRWMLSLDDRATQQVMFDRHFANDGFRGRFAAHNSRDKIAREGRDPSQFRYVEAIDVPGQLFERFRHVCTALPTSGNFYLEYFLTSTYRDLEAGPPYLRRREYARLRHLVDRVEVITCELGDHLDGGPAGRYSKANLSDLFEYLSEDESAELLTKLTRALRPGGRLCFWNLFVPRAPAPPLRRHLRARPELADALWRTDRAFFYRAFHLEEVVS